MDRLVLHAVEHLARRVPAVAPLPHLERALHRDRVAVTTSVLERSLVQAEVAEVVDPWRGPNRGVPWRSRERWVVLAPVRLDEGPATAIDRTHGAARRAAGAIDRTVRTLGVRGDRHSHTSMARWARLCDEGVRFAVRARARPRREEVAAAEDGIPDGRVAAEDGRGVGRPSGSAADPRGTASPGGGAGVLPFRRAG